MHATRQLSWWWSGGACEAALEVDRLKGEFAVELAWDVDESLTEYASYKVSSTSFLTTPSKYTSNEITQINYLKNVAHIYIYIYVTCKINSSMLPTVFHELGETLHVQEKNGGQLQAKHTTDRKFSACHCMQHQQQIMEHNFHSNHFPNKTYTRG